MTTDSTEWGFPKGRVAKTLRTVLDPLLNEHQGEAVVVCLMAHLLVETRINEVLYRWLKRDAPEPNDPKQTPKTADALWNAIVRMDFAKKYSLVDPFFSAHFPAEASDVWKINDLRNEIFHGRRAVQDATFKGQPLADEKAVESLFIGAQLVSMQLDKFDELVDLPHALAERWSTRLRELGDPLALMQTLRSDFRIQPSAARFARGGWSVCLPQRGPCVARPGVGGSDSC
jgi:hypothetical protein